MMYSPNTDDSWPLRERVLAGVFFMPLSQGYFNVDELAQHYPATPAHLRELIRQLLDEGLAERAPPSVQQEAYGATQAGWVARESLLVSRGLRHPAMLHQAVHQIEDLILAIAAAPIIHDSKLSGGMLGEEPAVSFLELLIYLHERPEVDVRAAAEALLADPRGLLKRCTKHNRQLEKEPAVALTKLGQDEYERRAAPRLGIASGGSILEFEARTHLAVFWAWQSEFPASSNLFQAALDSAIRHINANLRPTPALKLIVASEPGEGALRIDVEVQNKIRGAEFFVGDITAVYQYGRRLRVNENVLVEVGYALASKDPGQILLLGLARDSVPGSSDGPASRAFDIAHVSHRELPASAALQEVYDLILSELKGALLKRGYLRAPRSGVATGEA